MARVKTSTLFFALYVILLSFHYVESIKSDLKEGRKLKDAMDALMQYSLEPLFVAFSVLGIKNPNNIKEIAKSGGSNVSMETKLTTQLETVFRHLSNFHQLGILKSFDQFLNDDSKEDL
ncbi:hypothetical protein HNY73_002003 [Argiope bruennichi]|uniref:Uncharacterized protein n=1 Tax=Argiope bruennichi TaxID=94029 RepID=A0A8T0FS49_ARGBR|nr:hypothetical protein HNY73_002003 [Argiope bruennichi]